MRTNVAGNLAAFNSTDEIASLEVVYKISERCNLACDYCYFFFRGDETYKLHPAVAPPEVSDALGQFIDDAVASYNIKAVNIVLHGGEPLMLPKPKFADLIERIRARYHGAAELRFVMQTNGALVTPAWISLLNSLKIGTGVSFDGPAHIHDAHRRDRRGRPSYADCRRGWDLLRDSAERGEGILPGLLCVINPDVEAGEVFDHFVHDLGAVWMNFLVPDVTHDDAEFTPEFAARVGQYMIDVFDRWAALNDKGVRIRFIQETLTPIARPDMLGMLLVKPNDMRNQISIASNGEIFPEDTVKILPGYQKSPLTVFNSRISDVFGSDAWLDLNEATHTTPAACTDCDWVKICNGGRLHNRFSLARKFDNPSIYCSGLSNYYEHITAAVVSGGGDLDRIHAALTGTQFQ